ncbi:MAG: phosphoserine phosphatase [Methanomethylophilus sp.]|nr:phosphoserine phosphatase [Methanomethylophilus sp.]MDD4221968.1 phosphoserine phosphatase [Methanomethylophilus sp.]MDD4668313.1 phosphoserine phosphatase [Methanomethylophilus sp.]
MVDVEDVNQVDSQEEKQETVAEPQAEQVAVEQPVAEPAAPAAETAADENDDGEPTEAEKAKLKDLEEQRAELNNDAEKHRIRRDELNAETKDWKNKRDALNAQVRALVDEAGKNREVRDGFNQKVREVKAVRDEWNGKVSELKDKIRQLRPEPSDDRNGEVSVSQMKRELERLERTQETQSMEADKEKALVKQISVLARQIEEKEKTDDGDDAIRDLVQQLRDAKAKAEEAHHEVSVNAEQAQEAHDKMLSLYQQADALRKEADAAQAKFVECKQAADEEHRLHIEQIKSVHEISRSADGIKNKKFMARKKRADVESKKEAKEIFEKFKNGEKLSTEDLMTLQKSGYL